MDTFLQFLYRSKILPITESLMEKWWNQKEVELLIIATEVGSGKNRLKALDWLRTMPSYSSRIKGHLIKILYAKNLYLADRAHEILEKNYMPRELEEDESYKVAVRFMKEYRNYIHQLMEYNATSSTGLEPLRKSKDEMTRLNKAKKDLRKGYRSGF